MYLEKSRLFIRTLSEETVLLGAEWRMPLILIRLRRLHHLNGKHAPPEAILRSRLRRAEWQIRQRKRAQ
jgi:aminoglycoside phosphotransferase